MPMDLDYDRDAYIQKENLEYEVLRQGQLVSDTGKMKAKAAKYLRDFSVQKKLRMSEITLEIRQADPKDYGLTKYTEGAIESIALQQEEVQTLISKESILMADLEAIEIHLQGIVQKRAMLEIEYNGIKDGLFSQPNFNNPIPEATKDAVKRGQDAASESLATSRRLRS